MKLSLCDWCKEQQKDYLLKEWDCSRNSSNPSSVSYGSNLKVWWKCDKGHEWQAVVFNRTVKGYMCPYCSNQKLLVGYNDLKTLYPLVAEEWDLDKNSTKPSEYSAGSYKKAWWLCPKGHSYEASIHNRTNGKTGCPYCANQKILVGFNDFQTMCPQLVIEWDYSKNVMQPTEIFSHSHKNVWWICKNGHSYQATVANRCKGTGCPICNKQKKSSFAEQAIFYYVKQAFTDAINGYKNKDILGPRMELDIYIPSIKVGIEYDGRAFHKRNAIEKDNRKYELCHKNNIKLIRIMEQEPSNVWKLCDNKIVIQPNDSNWLNYAINNVCMYLGKIVVPNVERDRQTILSLLEKRVSNLAEQYPKIADEWDYEKNYPLTPHNVAPHSSHSVWWICKKGHSWKARVGNRTEKGNACPICSKLMLPKYAKTNLSSYRKDVAELWDFEKNGDLTPSMVGGKSNRHVWFQCSSCGYSWNERIYNVVKRKYLCPHCKDKSHY